MPPICDDGIALQPGGALVLLEELVVVEPTAAQAAQRRERREQALRTFSITAPAECFGTVVPYAGQRVRIDLDDPRLTISGVLPASGGVVTGVTRQVGVVRSTGLIGVSVPASIEPGIAAADVTADLFVVLVLDDMPG